MIDVRVFKRGPMAQSLTWGCERQSVQRRCGEPRRCAGTSGRADIVVVAQAARADEVSLRLQMRCASSHVVQGLEIGSFGAADAVERHHNHTAWPQVGTCPAVRPVQWLQVAAVERQDRIRESDETARKLVIVRQRFACKHRCGLADRPQEPRCIARSSETSIDPELRGRKRFDQRAQHIALRLAAGQRIDIGHIQHIGTRVAQQCARDVERIRACDQCRSHRPIRRSLPAHGVHHLAGRNIDNRDQLHARVRL